MIVSLAYYFQNYKTMKFFTLKGKCLCPLNMPRITFPRPLKVMLPPEVLVRSQQPKSIRCSLERPPITPQPPPFLLFSTYWIKKNHEMTDCETTLWDLMRKIMRNTKKGNNFLRYGCQQLTRFGIFQISIMKLLGWAWFLILWSLSKFELILTTFFSKFPRLG